MTFNLNECFMENMKNEGKLIAKGKKEWMNFHLRCEHA